MGLPSDAPPQPRREEMPVSPKDGTMADSVQPFRILILSLFCQICAGVVLWYPAIASGIQNALLLSNSQISILVLIATSGGASGIIGGFIHQRLGNRLSGTFGCLGLATSYFLTGVLTALQVSSLGRLVYIFLIVLTFGIVLCSFLIYATAISTSAAVFPPEYRGRVVGLCSVTYGGSGAVFSAFQAAFYPKIEQTTSMIFAVSAYCFIIGIATFLIVPKLDIHDPHSMCVFKDYRPISEQEFPLVPYISRRFRYLYGIMFVCFVLLQAAAIADLAQLPTALKIATEVGVIVTILTLLVIPATTGLYIFPQGMASDEQRHSEDDAIGNGTDTNGDVGTVEGCEIVSEEPPLADVLGDLRYMYFLGCSTFLNGGGGVVILVQLPNLLKALRYAEVPKWDKVPVTELIRGLVTLFSACNMGSRLTMGLIMDAGRGEIGRHMWKYSLLVASTGLMSTALALCAMPSGWTVIFGVAAAGLAWGSFYATEPTLLTSWFGVRSFPRNVSLATPFETVGAALFGSLLPEIFREAFGAWRKVAEDGKQTWVCGGTLCTTPLFASLAVLCSTLVVTGVALRYTVRRKAEARLF